MLMFAFPFSREVRTLNSTGGPGTAMLRSRANRQHGRFDTLTSRHHVLPYHASNFQRGVTKLECRRQHRTAVNYRLLVAPPRL